MGRPRSRRDDNLRRQVAYFAARLVAEEGMTDYWLAKQKAARQAGVTDSRLLPDNHEVEDAVREYQGLYQREQQPGQLRHLREVAAKVMRELSAFRPHLVGSVLNGTANRHSVVSLQLFVDDTKALSLFLLNRRWGYELVEKLVKSGEGWNRVPQFVLEVDGEPVTLTVYALLDERNAPRGRTSGELPARANLAEVEALLAA